MRIVKTGSIGLLLIALTGCALRPPKLWHAEYPPSLTGAYTVADYRQDEKVYKDAIAAGNMPAAMLARNDAIDHLRTAINNSFNRYSQGLAAVRATAGLGSDILQSGLAAGSNIFTNGQLKNILSGSLLGVKSITGSVRAEIHIDVNPEIMIMAMNARRAPYLDKIKAGKKLDASQYSLGDALDDLNNLFWAGTLESGRLQLTEQAGKAAQTSTVK